MPPLYSVPTQPDSPPVLSKKEAKAAAREKAKAEKAAAAAEKERQKREKMEAVEKEKKDKKAALLAIKEKRALDSSQQKKEGSDASAPREVTVSELVLHSNHYIQRTTNVKFD